MRSDFDTLPHERLTKLEQAIETGDPVPVNAEQQAEIAAMKTVLHLRWITWMVLVALGSMTAGIILRLWPVLWLPLK